MYGDTCIGIVTSMSEFSLGMKLVMWLVEDSELTEALEGGCYHDSMGMNTIIYFRGITAPSTEEVTE
jgi:hypothetical protein